MSGAYRASDWERFHPDDSRSETRTPAQRDRDRILYTLAFRRLAGVTQVVGAVEGHIFHNRLTHTIEVAQIARRLCEHYIAEHPDTVERIGGLEPEVAEAAALAHDLGHPPFGHIAEHELNSLATRHRNPDGFEGNAQSFRILNRLAAHRAPIGRDGYSGLNLTRRTLNAVLKYPWVRDLAGRRAKSKRYRKFSTYRSEEREFLFARAGYEKLDSRSPEAAIMDHADDVAYSVHDLDDFYRAGLIPVSDVVYVPAEQEAFFKWWVSHDKLDPPEIRARREELIGLLDLVVTGERYRGTFAQRATMRSAASLLIGKFIYAAYLREPDNANPEFIHVDRNRTLEMNFLKALVRYYVIANPRLATQQSGQRRVVRHLFRRYLHAVQRREESLIPPLFENELRDLGARRQSSEPEAAETRLAVDMVASLTDKQATAMHRRFSGVDSGSVLDLLDV